MGEKTIRIGLIGAGQNTRERHIPGLNAQPDVEIVSVANRSRESGERVAREFGIRKVAANWMEIVEDSAVDAVCIGTWPNMHAPITIAALERGKHVLCEARMAMNSGEARAMLQASRRRPDLVAQIVPAPYTLHIDRTIIEMISEGQIGDVVQVDARIALNSDYPDPEAPLNWRHDRNLSGNNTMTLGIIYECMLRWLGPAKSVFALGQNVVRHRRDHDGRRHGVDLPDDVDVVGELQGGGLMRLCVSTVLGDAPMEVDTLIFGTEGTLRILKAGPQDLVLFGSGKGGGGLQPIPIDPAKEGRWRVEEEFVSAIRGKEPVTRTDFVTGVQYMEWTDAVAISLRHRRLVPLPLALAE